MERRAIFGPLFTTFSTCDRSIGRPTIENRLTHPLKGKEGSPWHALGFFSRHLTSRHSAQREQCGRLTNQRKRTWPRSVLVRFVERKWSLLRRSLPRRAIQFYLASRASTSPRKRATSTTLPPPHGNRRSDEPEPLEFAEPEPTSVSLKRPLSFDANRCQSCVYSDGPNPSSTLLRGCEACTEAGDGEIVPFRGIVRKGFGRGRIAFASIFRYLWGRFDRCAIWNYD